MKKLAIFFQKTGKYAAPLNEEAYLVAYRELAKKIEESDIECYFVRGIGSYLGSGIFKTSYRFINGEIQESGEIKADLVYDKGDQGGFTDIDDGAVKVFNHPKITEICTDKWKTYEYFADYCPKTFIVRNLEELSAALNTLETEKKVVKPLDLGGGKGVEIANNEILIDKKFDFPVLVQEFLNSSKGMPGIIKGLHDFRIVMCNGVPVHSFVRTPPEGKFKANVSKGGSLKHIEVADIPSDALVVASQVDLEFAQFGDRLFSVDLANTEEGYKIIEINARPGFPYSKSTESLSELRDKIAETLIKIMID